MDHRIADSALTVGAGLPTTARPGGQWGASHTFALAVTLLAAFQLGSTASRSSTVVVEVGEVTVVVDQARVALGTAMGEASSGTQEWLGLGRVDLGRIRLVLAADQKAFGRWTRGMVPEWSAGATWPDRHLVVIRLDAGDPFETLRHELAHLALHLQIQGRVPRWFDEGYAVLAAGEFNRLAGLRLNFAVARGRVPTLDGLDRDLLGNAGDAETAYALAGSVVSTIARVHPSGQLTPFLDALRGSKSFEGALAEVGLGAGQLEEDWYRVLRREYNTGVWLVTGGAWLIFTLLLGLGAAWRRGKDAVRREALNVGWELPVDDTGITNSDQSFETLDPTGAGN